MMKPYFKANVESLNTKISFQTVFDQIAGEYQKQAGETVANEEMVAALRQLEQEGVIVLYGNKNKPVQIGKGNGVAK